jgi:hypothetical protein
MRKSIGFVVIIALACVSICAAEDMQRLSSKYIVAPLVLGKVSLFRSKSSFYVERHNRLHEVAWCDVYGYLRDLTRENVIAYNSNAKNSGLIQIIPLGHESFMLRALR